MTGNRHYKKKGICAVQARHLMNKNLNYWYKMQHQPLTELPSKETIIEILTMLQQMLEDNPETSRASLGPYSVVRQKFLYCFDDCFTDGTPANLGKFTPKVV